MTKYNRETLNEKNYSVFLKKEDEQVPRRVVFPEEVDISTGTVKMWVPVPPTTDLQEVDPEGDMEKITQPAEIDGVAELRTETGKVFIMNSVHNIIHEST